VWDVLVVAVGSGFLGFPSRGPILSLWRYLVKGLGFQ
jgi:hypothetical protein